MERGGHARAEHAGQRLFKRSQHLSQQRASKEVKGLGSRRLRGVEAR